MLWSKCLIHLIYATYLRTNNIWTAFQATQNGLKTPKFRHLQLKPNRIHLFYAFKTFPFMIKMIYNWNKDICGVNQSVFDPRLVIFYVIMGLMANYH